MESQDQGAGGNVERDLPKLRSWPKQVPQVPHCGLPGRAQENFWHLPRPLQEIFHIHLSGLSHSLQASLQPDSPPRVSILIMHSRMEKQTQAGLGERDLGRRQKLGHVTEEAAAQAESRLFQRRKAVTLAHLEVLRF